MRKTSDIAMLLGSRSKSRSRGFRGSRRGVVGSILGLVDTLLGRGSKGRRNQRSQTVPMMVFVVGLLSALGSGFLLGDWLDGGAGDNPLNARIGQQPGFINEVDTAKLADDGFVVSVYEVTERRTEAEARQSAADLAKYLRGSGLEKSRPLKYNGQIWATVVYYEGASERDRTRDLLLNMPEDVPCAEFCHWRKDSDWPHSAAIE